MQTNDTIIQDSQAASEYDTQACKTNWLGPEVIFGLAYELVRPGDSLLDLGIGSGLGSVLFHQAGLQVFGLDGAAEILEICAAKNFAAELKQHGLRDLPLPYPSRCYDHVLSIAVLNSFQELAWLFEEVARIIKLGGMFAFTVEEQKSGQEQGKDMKTIPESHRYLIDGPYHIALSTVMPDGQPQVTPVWCNRDGDYLLINTMKGFRKEKNMRANPKVTLFAYDPKDPLLNIEIRGLVIEMIEGGVLEHLDELTQLYLDKPEAKFFGDSVPPELQSTHVPVRIKIAPTHVRIEG